jgi:hypothetical protein
VKANYLLTAFSPLMFGERATVHIRVIDHEKAAELVDGRTRLLATRPDHQLLAEQQFGHHNMEVVRYSNLKSGMVAVHMHYRGPTVDNNTTLPFNSTVTYSLIEIEEYQED